MNYVREKIIKKILKKVLTNAHSHAIIKVQKRDTKEVTTMAQPYEIEFLDTLEKLTNTTTDHLLDSIEDNLYIHQELTPCVNRCSWAYPFLRGEKVKFTYHNCEFVWVWMDAQGKVWVKDI